MVISKTNLIFLAVIFVLLFFAFYTRSERDCANVSQENIRKFEFSSNIDLFQFEGDFSSPAQKKINLLLSDVKKRRLEEFKLDFAEFLEDEDGYYNNYKPSLEIRSSVKRNTPTDFSARIDITAWHQGAVGNPSEVETFNFKIMGDNLVALSLADIIPDSKIRLKTIAKAVKKIKEKYADDEVLNAINSDDLAGLASSIYKDIIFTFDGTYVEIIFPSGTLTGRALGNLSAEVKVN